MKHKSKIKQGSEVCIITGSEKGKKGKVLKILSEKGRVIIENIALKKKKIKATQEKPEGGIVEQEGSIHISNVKLIEPIKQKNK